MDQSRGWTHPTESGSNGIDFDLLPTAKWGKGGTRMGFKHEIRSEHAKT